jgi:thiol-disulfide isomerase/thioredoxin
MTESNRFMMTLLALIALLLPVGNAAAADDPPEAKKAAPMLLGACARDSLMQEPYVDWYNKFYEPYTPNAAVLAKLQAVPTDYEIVIFFGSWCGDSKREVPRFLKICDALSFPKDKLSLIGVTNVDSLKKQSPGGEERTQDIYRVPTFIVKRNGIEINRIVEFPLQSLERDLLQIVSGGAYTPNYRSYPLLAQWLQDGVLSDVNVTSRGLANEVRHVVSSEGELSAAGYVLLGRALMKEAVLVFRMNVSLFPESSDRRVALAKALHQAGEHADAEREIKKALELNDDPERQDDILALLDRVRESRRLQAADEEPAEE